MPPARRRTAFALLALLALVALGAGSLPLLAADCADDCAPDCGDCLSCGVVADAVPAARLAGGLASCGLAPVLSPASSSPPTGQLDHVPLRVAA